MQPERPLGKIPHLGFFAAESYRGERTGALVAAFLPAHSPAHPTTTNRDPVLPRWGAVFVLAKLEFEGSGEDLTLDSPMRHTITR